jgi:hypothetical protein
LSLTVEHERLLGLVSGLRETGWVFVPTTLAAPGAARVVDALFGIRTRGLVEDNIQLWEKWAVASRLRRVDGVEIQLWYRSGTVSTVVEELLLLAE